MIAIIDFIGAAFFLAAFVTAIKNYNVTRGMSSYWFIFAIATATGFLWAGLVGLEWLNIYPMILDEVQQLVLTVCVTVFAVLGILSAQDIVKPA